MKDCDFNPETLPDLLAVYYKRLFPYGPYYRWLSYGNGRYFYAFQTYAFIFVKRIKVSEEHTVSIFRVEVTSKKRLACRRHFADYYLQLKIKTYVPPKHW
jgi:hypothetical protein